MGFQNKETRNSLSGLVFRCTSATLHARHTSLCTQAHASEPYTHASRIYTCLCTHTHTSEPLHARVTRTHTCARMYIRVRPYTHGTQICARTHVTVSRYAHAPRIYTCLCTHVHTSEPLHARVTHTHTCARMYIRVRPYTHDAHICARMHMPVSPYTLAEGIYTCLFTHARTSEPLHARVTHTHTCARMYIRVRTYTHGAQICARTHMPVILYTHAPRICTPHIHMLGHACTYE